MIFVFLILVHFNLYADEVNPAQDFLLSGVIAKSEHIKSKKAIISLNANVAIIRDVRSSKTHVLKVGDLIPSTVRFYVLEISKEGVKIGDGSREFKIQPAPTSNDIGLEAKKERSEPDDDETLEPFESIEELLDNLRSNEHLFDRKL